MNRFSVLPAVLTTALVLLCISGKSNSFSASENPHNLKYSIGDIEFDFKTTQSFDESEIEKIMNLPNLNSFTQYELDQDRQRIRKFYFDNGYFDAVVDTSTSADRDNEEVNVTIIIIENKRYKIDKINIEGLDSVASYIRPIISAEKILIPGNYYSKTEILKESGRIIEVLQNNGYLYASLDTNEGTVISKYQTDNPSLKYKVNVSLRFMGTDKQYIFGKTKINIIENKYRLEEYLIERELNYKEGQIYSRQLLERSERNLSKFSIIQSGRFYIDTVIGNSLAIRVDITLSKKYEITPHILGINDETANQFFVGAGVQYSDKNFFGGGRVFSVSLQGLAHSLNTYKVIFNTSLYQPYFIRNNMTLTYTLKLQYYNVDEGFQILLASNLLRTNYYIADYTFYNSAYSDITFDFIRTKITSEYIKRVEQRDTIDVLNNSINSIIGLTLVHDNTNDLFNPSRGFFHSITAENAGLIPKLISVVKKNIDYSQYIKLYMPNKFYFDLSGGRANSIFATYNEIGDIIEYGKGENIVPVPEIYSFFSGGSSSLRGWDAKQNGILDNTELGGKFLFEGAFEYRWKTFASSQSFIQNFWLVYFIDYGNVWESDGYFKLKEIALATGIGIRYDTFVGPLRVDLGFKLYDPSAEPDIKWLFDKKSQVFKNKFAVHFGLGNAF